MKYLQRTTYRESTVEWMKPRIKSMIWNIRKQKNQSEQQEEKRIQRNGESISHLSNNFKRSNICTIVVPEGEEKDQEIGNLQEKIMKENSPNLVKETDMQVQGAHRVPNKMDVNRSTPKHIIIKRSKVKDKERILKAAREKQLVNYRGVPIRLSVDFSKETLQARWDWQETFKVMKSRDLQPRLLYPAKT